MNLADLEKTLADVKPLPEPFNGATQVFLAQDAFDAIAPHMHVAFPFGGPTIEVREALPEGHGIGYRPWRAGDDPDYKPMVGAGLVVCWVLAKKKPD